MNHVNYRLPSAMSGAGRCRLPPGGYSGITWWTNDVMADARRIYQRASFTLDGESRHQGFGQDLASQNWSRRL